MPAKLKMTLFNGNMSASYIASVQSQQVVKSTTSIPSSLKNSMISRIHNVKPGCGGCGRH
jgi:hypothetical protein